MPDEKNAELFSIMKQQVISQVVNQTVHTAEFSALYRRLREMELHPVVVKGQLCSRLYPMKDHRISADDDIYVSDDEFLKCHNALTEYGLKTECAEEDLLHEDEVTYKDTERMLYVEMHRRLFDSSEDAHDELNGFFSDIHSRCVETDGFYSMPPHEHLLYLILHAYKHFVSCGVGLRQFFDIGFWAREYESEIDFDMLYRQCESVHAATFASVIFSVCRERLGISFEPGEIWKCDVRCEPMLHDVLCGGIYGSNRLHKTAFVNGNSQRSQVEPQREKRQCVVNRVPEEDIYGEKISVCQEKSDTSSGGVDSKNSGLYKGNKKHTKRQRVRFTEAGKGKN